MTRVKLPIATTEKTRNEKPQEEKKKEDDKYEIIDTLGVLSESPAGWTKEVNLVRWYGKPAKIDIRDWSPSRQKIGRGITLTDEEVQEFIRILQERI